jgi:aromatic ring-opening dioxygenase catalytic subunit (LigB family)
MDLSSITGPEETGPLAAYLKEIPSLLPQRPRAMLVISAHWEARVPTVMTSPTPCMLYDYSGFPPEMYRIAWPAPGDPKLAAQVRARLEAAGIRTAEDSERGFDHGAFVPLKLAYPNADMPTLQLSLEEGLDPARHLAIGRALAPLREEGVLLLGSGMSFHNLRTMRTREGIEDSIAFDAWFQCAVVAEPAVRDAGLVRWKDAPSARQAHPREEHLLPVMVIAGAAGADRGRIAFSGRFAGSSISAVHFVA